MNYKEMYNFWLKDPFFDDDTKEELKSITDEKEIEDRFYCNLKFGTGGMRGVMGAGTNRINKYTVGRATLGFANYLLDSFSSDDCKKRGVAIAYDTRNNSFLYAKTTSDILSGAGISVYLLKTPVPTPQLSFTVRKYNCIAGIVITASHNPKEYNGYKIYDENGGQLVVRQAKQVISFVDKVSDYRDVCFSGNDELVKHIDTTDEYTDAVISQTVCVKKEYKDNLSIVYTPLHGTGYVPVKNTLLKAGFLKLNIVEEQVVPDGDFPTVFSPNPEEKNTLDMALNLAKDVGADIVLGTDPDCDRVGVGVREKDGGYKLLTGNQMGALIADFVISNTDLGKYKKPALVKTVVTSDLGAEIAKANGFSVFETLTGFKFVGEKITQFEKAKREGDDLRDFDFLVGYEESFGYLAGTYARDKDGVGPCLLICEMAALYKSKNITLIDRLEELYEKYGYYFDAQESKKFKGKDGKEKMKFIMDSLRSKGSPFSDTKKVIDYKTEVCAEEGFGKLPSSDVLKFVLNDGSFVAVRPSGTEPKMKIYYNIRGRNFNSAEQKYRDMREIMLKNIGI